MDRESERIDNAISINTTLSDPSSAAETGARTEKPPDPGGSSDKASQVIEYAPLRTFSPALVIRAFFSSWVILRD